MPLNCVDWISLEVRTSQLNLSGGDDFQSIQDQKSLSMYFILKIYPRLKALKINKKILILCFKSAVQFGTIAGKKGAMDHLLQSNSRWSGLA